MSKIEHTNTFSYPAQTHNPAQKELKFNTLHHRLGKYTDKVSVGKKNFAVADLSFIIKTKPTPRAIEAGAVGSIVSVSIPIRVGDKDFCGYSSFTREEKKSVEEFYKGNKAIKSEKGHFHPQAHGHSEAYLYYYLQSKEGMDYILDQLQGVKGLNGSNVQEVQQIRLNLHTTNSVCGACTELTNGSDQKDGFKKSFTHKLKITLRENGIEVPEQASFEVCPSYRQKYKDGTPLPHLHPDTLKNSCFTFSTRFFSTLNIPELAKEKAEELLNRHSLVDHLKKDSAGQYAFDFEQRAHTAFSSSSAPKLIEDFTRGIKKQNREDATKLEKIANAAQVVIARNFRASINRKNFRELPFSKDIDSLVSGTVEEKASLRSRYKSLRSGSQHKVLALGR